jgi:hypothetical protein
MMARDRHPPTLRGCKPEEKRQCGRSRKWGREKFKNKMDGITQRGTIKS